MHTYTDTHTRAKNHVRARTHTHIYTHTQAEAYPKIAFDKEDESAWEGGALTEDGEDILAGHVAGIHHKLHITP